MPLVNVQSSRSNQNGEQMRFVDRPAENLLQGYLDFNVEVGFDAPTSNGEMGQLFQVFSHG